MRSLQTFIDETTAEDWLSMLPEEDQQTVRHAFEESEEDLFRALEPRMMVQAEWSVMDKIKKEFDLFLCGHPDYEDARKDIDDFINKKGGAKDIVMAAIAAALSPVIGPGFAAAIAWGVTVLLSRAANVGIKKYCELNPIEA